MHGFSAMAARTILDEVLGFPPDFKVRNTMVTRLFVWPLLT